MFSSRFFTQADSKIRSCYDGMIFCFRLPVKLILLFNPFQHKHNKKYKIRRGWDILLNIQGVIKISNLFNTPLNPTNNVQSISIKL